MISIVLPVYNGERFLRESIDSILEQSFTDLELIVVNDCSTDSTLSIVESYMERDPRVRCITNEVNKRLPASLNVGFAAAKGEYFTWTSDDNRYHRDALLKMHTYLKDHGDISLVYAPMNRIDESGEIRDNWKKNSSIESPGNIYLKNVVGACFLYKSEVHETLGGYDTERFLSEDYDFWLRAYRLFRFGYIPERLYDYREHDKSLTTGRSLEIYRMHRLVLQRQLKEDLPFRERMYIYMSLLHSHIKSRTVNIRKFIRKKLNY